MDASYKEYNVPQIKNIISCLKEMFDIVRVVDPIQNHTYIFNDDNSISYENYVCYKVWNKSTRCDNCISLKSFYEQARITKYEFVGKEVYYIVSRPITLVDETKKEHRITLEVVSNITNEVVFEASENEKLIDKINQTNNKIYRDSLTNTYNRRYYDEHIFCHSSSDVINKDFVFILLDLKKFKQINDKYGHSAGDWVLKEVASVLKDSIRKQDSVIRMGGDEFLIILNGCDEDQANLKIEKFSERLAAISSEKYAELEVRGNFGYSFTDNFIDSDEFIKEMLDFADYMMYKKKNKNIDV